MHIGFLEGESAQGTTQRQSTTASQVAGSVLEAQSDGQLVGKDQPRCEHLATSVSVPHDVSTGYGPHWCAP